MMRRTFVTLNSSTTLQDICRHVERYQERCQHRSISGQMSVTERAWHHLIIQARQRDAPDPPEFSPYKDVRLPLNVNQVSSLVPLAEQYSETLVMHLKRDVFEWCTNPFITASDRVTWKKVSLLMEKVLRLTEHLNPVIENVALSRPSLMQCRRALQWREYVRICYTFSQHSKHPWLSLQRFPKLPKKTLALFRALQNRKLSPFSNSFRLFKQLRNLMQLPTNVSNQMDNHEFTIVSTLSRLTAMQLDYFEQQFITKRIKAPFGFEVKPWHVQCLTTVPPPVSERAQQVIKSLLKCDPIPIPVSDDSISFSKPASTTMQQQRHLHSETHPLIRWQDKQRKALIYDALRDKGLEKDAALDKSHNDLVQYRVSSRIRTIENEDQQETNSVWVEPKKNEWKGKDHVASNTRKVILTRRKSNSKKSKIIDCMRKVALPVVTDLSGLMSPLTKRLCGEPQFFDGWAETAALSKILWRDEYRLQCIGASMPEATPLEIMARLYECPIFILEPVPGDSSLRSIIIGPTNKSTLEWVSKKLHLISMYSQL